MKLFKLSIIAVMAFALGALIVTQPAVLQKLKTAWDRYAKDVGVVPSN